MSLGGGEDAVDEFGGGAGTGGVVDGDVGAIVWDKSKGVLNGLPAVVGAPLADFDSEQAELVAVAEQELVVGGGGGGGAGDDDGGDGVEVGEEFDGALEDGPAAEVFVDLAAQASRGGVAGGGAGGGDDEGDSHGNHATGPT